MPKGGVWERIWNLQVGWFLMQLECSFLASLVPQWVLVPLRYPQGCGLKGWSRVGKADLMLCLQNTFLVLTVCPKGWETPFETMENFCHSV